MKQKNGFVISTTLYSIFGIMLLTVFYILYLLSNNRYVLTSSIDEVKSGLEKSDKKIYVKIVYDDGVKVDFEEIRKKLNDEFGTNLTLVADKIEIEEKDKIFYDEDSYPKGCEYVEGKPGGLCNISAVNYHGLYIKKDSNNKIDDIYFLFSNPNCYTTGHNNTNCDNYNKNNDKIEIIILSAKSGKVVTLEKSLDLANYYYYISGTRKLYNDSANIETFYNGDNNKIIFKVNYTQSFIDVAKGNDLDKIEYYGDYECNISVCYNRREKSEYYSLDLTDLNDQTPINNINSVPNETDKINTNDYYEQQQNYRCSKGVSNLSNCKENLKYAFNRYITDDELDILKQKLSNICQRKENGYHYLNNGCDVTVIGNYLLLTSNSKSSLQNEDNYFYDLVLTGYLYKRYYAIIELNDEILTRKTMYLSENVQIDNFDEKYYFIFSNSLNDGDNINIEDNFSESLSGFKGYIVSNNAMVTTDTDTTTQTMNNVIYNKSNDAIVGVEQFKDDKASDTTYIKNYILEQIK